jgi:hypothetical protein
MHEKHLEVFLAQQAAVHLVPPVNGGVDLRLGRLHGTPQPLRRALAARLQSFEGARSLLVAGGVGRALLRQYGTSRVRRQVRGVGAGALRTCDAALPGL